MNRFSLILIFLFILIPASGLAEEVSSYSSETASFTLMVLGTRNFGDVDTLSKSIKRLPMVKRLIPSFESQNHIRLTGEYTGEMDTLVTEIQGLVAEKFDMKSKKERQKGITITLKKNS